MEETCNCDCDQAKLGYKTAGGSDCIKVGKDNEFIL